MKALRNFMCCAALLGVLAVCLPLSVTLPLVSAETTVTGPTVTGPVETATLPRSDARLEKDPTENLPRLRFRPDPTDPAEVVEEIISAMTLEEKIGQLCQAFPGGASLSDDLAGQIRSGQVSSIFYPGQDEIVQDAQRVAIEQSRLGIPLIVARDVIHGFRTIYPIPLGQAASWNPELIEEAAKFSAYESRKVGIHWTFAPMVDIARDPRWGRIAESPGEDPVLAAAVGTAMVRGFQLPDSNGVLRGVAACPKHFVAYGLSEGGRDYNRALVSRNELRNVFLPPFKACIDEQARTLMTAFNTVNGVPASGHKRLLREVLKDEWQFSGFVVSDWGSVIEMIKHGSVANKSEAAELSMQAGVDMEMVSTCYAKNMSDLLESGRVDMKLIDDAVGRILDTKARLNLFEEPYADPEQRELLDEEYLQTARELGRQSMVLLKNDSALPVNQDSLKKIAVIGPFADAPRDQLGTWVMDAKDEDSITPLSALKRRFGKDCEIIHVPCLQSKYLPDHPQYDAAVAAAKEADIALLFVGEEESFSGEAHSRTELGLPGSQARLVEAVGKLDVPTVMIINAGRPLTIGKQIEQVDAVLYGWQAGTMMGPAVVDLLLGVESPSGKLPVTFPKTVGQVPLYYNHPKTGRPAPDDYQAPSLDKVKNMPENVRYSSHYIDSDPFPLFPFGFGLSYTEFNYEDLDLSSRELDKEGEITVKVRVTNKGKRAGTEVVQLYVRDLVGSVVRPVRELKDFERVPLKPGESKVVEFVLKSDQLGFYNEDEEFLIEPGKFQLWVGGDSRADLTARFKLQ